MRELAVYALARNHIFEYFDIENVLGDIIDHTTVPWYADADNGLVIIDEEPEQHEHLEAIVGDKYTMVITRNPMMSNRLMLFDNDLVSDFSNEI